MKSELGLAAVYEYTSQSDSAIHLISNIIMRCKSHPNNKLKILANAYHNMANVYLGLKNYVLAENFIDSAIYLRQNQKDNMEYIQSLNNKIDILIYKNRISEAKSLLNAIEQLYKTITIPENEKTLNDYYVKVYLVLGDIDSATIYLHKMAAQYTVNLDTIFSKTNRKLNIDYLVTKPQALINTYNLLANNFYQKFLKSENLGNLDSALKYLLLAEDILADNNSRKFNVFDIYEYNKRSGALFQLMVDVYYSKFLHSGRIEDKIACYQTIEKAKSYVLADKYRADVSTTRFQIPSDLLMKENDFKLSLSSGLARIDDKRSDKESMKEYLRISRNYDEFLESLKVNYSEYYQSRFFANTINIDDLKKQLRVDELIIDYFLTPEAIYIAVLWNDGDTLIRVIDNKDIVLNINTFVNAIQSPLTGVNNLLMANNYLYTKLIAPIGSLVSKSTKITIIPDQQLWFVPFAGLFKPVNKITSFQNLDYLVKNQSISYNYSRTIWHQVRSKKIISAHSEGVFTGFAPGFCENCNCSNNLLVTRSAFLNNRPIPLPCTLSEMDSLNSIMQKSGIETNIFKASSAHLGNYKVFSSTSTYLHFATHAFVDTINYKKAYILLSSQNSKQIVDTLNISDILSSDLSHVDFVGLSACQTGIGKHLYGEGAISLGYYFKLAGANSVLGTLWSVYDKYTSTLITTFYQNMIQEKFEKAEALRLAQLELISKKNVYPLYWAGFQLISD